jgi:hypothetical protein
MKHKQESLFASEELTININGVRAVNSVDLHDLVIPFDSTPGQFIKLKDYFFKGEYILHSSGSYHYFKKYHIPQLRPGKLPKYFDEPVFPWIQSIHNKSGQIRVPGVPQSRAPYPFVSIGKNNKKLQMHVLCAGAFIQRPEDPEYCLVSHINHMKWDYSLRNLQWSTNKENSDGFKKERRMSALEIFDKWWDEFERGVEYDVNDWQKEEDQF